MVKRTHIIQNPVIDSIRGMIDLPLVSTTQALGTNVNVLDVLQENQSLFHGCWVKDGTGESKEVKGSSELVGLVGA